MSWSCPVSQKDFSRKDSMQRHMKGKHSNSNFAPVIPMSQEKCEWFQLVYPFTYLHGCRDDWFGENCLSTITVRTRSNRDRSTIIHRGKTPTRNYL